MVLTWQKPKYAPFDEQAKHELGDSALVVLEPEADAAPDGADDSGRSPGFESNPGTFEVDLLDSWLKP
jgi:hypothetical protein